MSVSRHFREKNNRSWKLGDEVVEESNEYKNLGIVKNYVSSFQSDVDEAIEKKNKKKGWNDFTLYFIIPRTGSSTQLTENRTTLDLSFLISRDVSTNSIVKVFIKQRRY